MRLLVAGSLTGLEIHYIPQAGQKSKRAAMESEKEELNSLAGSNTDFPLQIAIICIFWSKG
jgi:hypothetical protein